MFKHQIRIAYRDVTVGNHVYYARYLDFLEIARNEVFRSVDQSLLKLQNQGIIFPVVEISLKYHAPARYDDLLEIELWVSDLGKIQLTFEYRILRESTLLVTASTRHVATTLAEKPIRIPSELFQGLSSKFLKKSLVQFFRKSPTDDSHE